MCIWRSAVPCILHFFSSQISAHQILEEECHLLASVPALQPYFIERQAPPLYVQIQFAYFYPEIDIFQFQNIPILCYVLQLHRHDVHTQELQVDSLSIWQPEVRLSWTDWKLSFSLGYTLSSHFEFPCEGLAKYVNYTTHTPNDVLSAQADCPTDISLDEFIAFAHLQSGGSLQWLNILHGLRSRTLNLRRHQTHYLLVHVAFRVGPLDLDTGVWIWHHELQESSFCNALLDELDNLFMDVGAGLIDAVLMNTISLLLTRVLTSSPSEGVSDRAIVLLRSICRKIFSWVQELSYDLTMAPTNEECMNLLLDMAATCQSTFDVDPATLRKLFHSAKEVDALLSCIFFIHALHRECMSNC